mmetsp:Transcript_19613/g.52920  ORF Transcript_19613/g.52920 Transcript_19613/m.52920 type:complete len:258 (-) Transcript_19613:654-1427(-)
MRRPATTFRRLLLLALIGAASVSAESADAIAERVRRTKARVEQAGRNAVNTGRSAAQAAADAKRQADESGLTDLVIHAGRGAAKAGVDIIHNAAQAAAAYGTFPPPPLPPPASPPPSPLPQADGVLDSKANTAKQSQKPHHAHTPIHIDPAVIKALALTLAAIAFITSAACGMIALRRRRERAEADKVTLSALQPIYAGAPGGQQPAADGVDNVGGAVNTMPPVPGSAGHGGVQVVAAELEFTDTSHVRDDHDPAAS